MHFFFSFIALVLKSSFTIFVPSGIYTPILLQASIGIPEHIHTIIAGLWEAVVRDYCLWRIQGSKFFLRDTLMVTGLENDVY